MGIVRFVSGVALRGGPVCVVELCPHVAAHGAPLSTPRTPRTAGWGHVPIPGRSGIGNVSPEPVRGHGHGHGAGSYVGSV